MTAPGMFPSLAKCQIKPSHMIEFPGFVHEAQYTPEKCRCLQSGSSTHLSVSQTASRALQRLETVVSPVVSLHRDVRRSFHPH